MKTRARVIGLSVLGVVALYGLVGAVIVPPIAKHVIETRLTERLGRAFALEGVSVNPYTLRTTLKNIRIVDAASSFALQPLMMTAAIDARATDLVPLRACVPQFSTVAVRSAAASARGTATPEEPQGTAPAQSPRPREVRIDRITFVGSRLNFTDHFIKRNCTADVCELRMAAAPKDLSKEAREKLAAEPIEISAGELSALAKQRAEKVTG
ncbi:MAG: hypothetical protein ABIR98_02530, partial [Usitatibacter sp.]